LIDRTFSILQRNGVLPLPPPELQNKEVSVEYVSVLAQAQRLVNTGAIDRIMDFTGNVAGIWPGARHKIDANQAVDDYAESLGVDPALIRSDSEAQALADTEAQATAQAQRMAQAEQMAGVAKTASETDLGENNVLGATMERAGVS
jgi:hypothetical protein